MEKLKNPPQELESERLILRPVSQDYAQEIFDAFDDDVVKYTAFSRPTHINEETDYIRMAMAKNDAGQDFYVFIFRKDTGEAIGAAGLHHIDTKTPEFGIWTKTSAHGNKFGQEAIRAIKQWADQNLDYDYLSYPVVDVNIASRKIPETLGGTVARHYVDKDDQGQDMSLVEYRIIH